MVLLKSFKKALREMLAHFFMKVQNRVPYLNHPTLMRAHFLRYHHILAHSWDTPVNFVEKHCQVLSRGWEGCSPMETRLKAWVPRHFLWIDLRPWCPSNLSSLSYQMQHLSFLLPPLVLLRKVWAWGAFWDSGSPAFRQKIVSKLSASLIWGRFPQRCPLPFPALIPKRWG